MNEANDCTGGTGEVGVQATITGTVRTATRVNGFTPRTAERALIVLDTGEALVKFVTSAAWAYLVQRGDHLSITGTITAHTAWRGRDQTVLTRVSRLHTPSAAAQAETWEAVNPTEAGPRPFPRTTHPLAPAPTPARPGPD
jgi:hypothetical protein